MTPEEIEHLQRQVALLKQTLLSAADAFASFGHPHMADFCRRWAADPVAAATPSRVAPTTDVASKFDVETLDMDPEDKP